MKMSGRSSGQKGSMVVEASLVIPVVIMSILAVVYISVLLYQKVCMQCLADKAAARGAAAWANRAVDVETGRIRKEDLDKAGLYWRVIGLDQYKRDKELKVKNYINSGTGNDDSGSSKLDRFSLLKSIVKDKEKRVTVELEDYIVYKKLVVKLEDTYKVPAGNILSGFGLNSEYTIRVKSEAVVNAPPEFIRNTDFLLDLEREIEAKNPEVKNLGDKTRKVMNEVEEKILKFLND